MAIFISIMARFARAELILTCTQGRLATKAAADWLGSIIDLRSCLCQIYLIFIHDYEAFGSLGTRGNGGVELCVMSQ